MVLLGLLDASIQYTMLDSNLHHFNQPDLNGEFPLIHVMYIYTCKNTKEKDYAGSGSNLISSSTVVISTLILVA